MTSSLRTVSAMSLFVEDLAAAKAFYREVFGVPVVSEDDVSAVLGFENLMLNLLAVSQAHTLVGPGQVAAPGAGSRFQLSIWVEDVDAVCAALQQRGVALLTPPTDREWGMRTATFTDPAGHSWEVAQPLGSAPADPGPGSVVVEPAPDESVGALLAHLRSQRRHVLGILEDLDDEALRRPVLPSGWSCLGLVQHLALDVERFWFGAVVAGDQDVVDSLDPEDNAWQVPPDTSSQSVLDRYRKESERTDAILRDVALDSPPAWWPGDLFGSFRLADVGEVLLHVVVETSCHAGHLDAARELLDGRQWLVLD